jgi:tellurite resistance protein
MIIFGTRGVTYSTDSGEFYCPTCRGQIPYKHKRVRRFFTLYFIPLIPLDLLGEYIECQQCDNAFEPEVLHLDMEAGEVEFEAQFHQAIKRIMVVMMMADGNVADQEVEVIQGIYNQLTGIDLSREAIGEEIIQAEADGRNIANTLADLTGHLNDNGKEMVVKAAFHVAAADGEFQEEEKELIVSIGQALEMSSAHVNGLISSLLE